MEEKNNVRNWASDIGTGTLLQAEKAARSPGVYGPIALMPDAHIGIGATVGSVIATKNKIIPAAVGVDLGCGMIAIRLSMKQEDLPDDLQMLIDKLHWAIPAGVGKARLAQSNTRIAKRAEKWMLAHPNNNLDFKSGLAETALNQLGTLGSGNHFFEVCIDETGFVWLVLHSGSRGVGNKLASAHIKIARNLHKEFETHLEDPNLAFFTQGTQEFEAYITDMLWAQDYALENRELMMEAALDEFRHVFPKFMVTATINCHHNFAAIETHEFGDVFEEVWITRKGAIQAAVGDFGVIPGSMATGSYIVQGKGVAESYRSCSHGAGRRMSRTQAKKELTIESLESRMEGKAWNHNSKALLDEHPDAYKDIVQVMEDQKDLVEVVHVLTQVLNYKGV